MNLPPCSVYHARSFSAITRVVRRRPSWAEGAVTNWAKVAFGLVACRLRRPLTAYRWGHVHMTSGRILHYLTLLSYLFWGNVFAFPPQTSYKLCKPYKHIWLTYKLMDSISDVSLESGTHNLLEYVQGSAVICHFIRSILPGVVCLIVC